MVRYRLHGLVVVAVALASTLSIASVAWGQVVGSITGTVTDQTGVPLKGVRISAQSDTQIGGSKVVYSNDEGFFRIPGLQPGVFEVMSSSRGLKSVMQKQIRVGLNAPAEVYIMMEAETQSEEVRVIERAAVVSTTSAKVKETFDADFVDSLPTDKRTGYGGFIRDNVPGAADGGGQFAASDWLARVRGANANQNAIQVEGFTMTWHKITLNSLAAMEVLTAGNGAENAGTPGAVVNMVTQSGSNKYLFDVIAWDEPGQLRLFTDGLDNNHRDQRFFNPAFSGPIIKDKLWFYVNWETRDEHIGRDPDPSLVVDQPPPRYYWNLRGTVKLTWQATPRNKIQSFTLVNRESWQNVVDGYTGLAEAQALQDWQDWFSGITWESLLADNLFFKSQIGFQRFLRTRKPETCLDDLDHCLDIAPIQQMDRRSYLRGNFDTVNQLNDSSVELVNTLEYFLQTQKAGEHAFKFQSRFFDRNYETTDGVPGDSKIFYSGQLPDRRVEYFSNDPRVDSEAHHGFWVRASDGFRFSNSISDVIRLTRFLTLTPGVALTVNRAGTNRLGTVIDQKAFTPHVSLAWDATHDGRTVIRASYNHYVDTDAIRTVRQAMGDGVSRECKWNPATMAYDTDCKWAGGVRTIGLPCGPGGVNADGTSCREDLTTPRTVEYTLGMERELVPGLGVGADLVHRVFSHQYELAETNRIWNGAGNALAQGGAYRNGRAETVNNLSTPSDTTRRYVGLTVSAKKREGALKLTGSYTWSRLDGNIFLEEDNEYGDIPGRNVYLYGPSPYDRQHEVRASAAYQWNRWLSSGIVYNYYSGSPYSRKYYNAETAKYELYRAKVGQDAGALANDPSDDRQLRLPDIQKLNVQLRANLTQFIGYNLEVFTDFINILGLRTTTAVFVEDGATFGQMSARLDPFRVRLGARFRY
jgi:hypothetical protein